MPTAERRKQPRPVSTEDDLARFHASVAGGNHFPTTTRRPRTRANTGSDLAHARETTREKRRTERPRGAQSAETKGVALARRICEVPPRLAYRADVKKPETSSGFWNWWCSSPVEETSLPHGHCHRGRDFTLVAHPRENGPPPRICSLPQAMNGRRFDPQTRNRTGQSLQSIPHATPAAVLLQMVAFGQVAEVLLQGVPADPGQLDRIHHRDAPVLTGELHDLQ